MSEEIIEGEEDFSTREGRRSFLRKSGYTLAAVGGAAALTACGSDGDESAASASDEGSESVELTQEGETVEWDMTTSWPAGLSTLFGAEDNNSGALGFARNVNMLTGGRFVINTFANGDLAASADIVDVLQSGAVQAGHTASYFFRGLGEPWIFGTAVPFGLTFRQQASWLWENGGLEMLRSYYAENFNLINFPAGSTGVQMGGFFNREINSVDDLQGLTMRIPGLGGVVMSELGVTPQLIAPGDIAQNLATGNLDAAEFVGPFDDNNLGLGEAGNFYYFPGWWEPGAALDVFVNLDAYNELSPEFQNILEVSSKVSYLDTMAFYDRVQPIALQELIDQGVEIRRFPDDLMEQARAITEGILDDFAAADPAFADILGPWREYRDSVGRWHGTAELAMLEALSGDL